MSIYNSLAFFLGTLNRTRVEKLAELRIRIRIRKILLPGFGSRSGSNSEINQKLQKKTCVLSKTNIWVVEKEILQIFWSLNGSSSFSIKISKKITKKEEEKLTILLLLKFSKSQRNVPDSQRNEIINVLCLF